jgi:hypothetical protein
MALTLPSSSQSLSEGLAGTPPERLASSRTPTARKPHNCNELRGAADFSSGRGNVYWTLRIGYGRKSRRDFNVNAVAFRELNITSAYVE